MGHKTSAGLDVGAPVVVCLRESVTTRNWPVASNGTPAQSGTHEDGSMGPGVDGTSQFPTVGPPGDLPSFLPQTSPRHPQHIIKENLPEHQLSGDLGWGCCTHWSGSSELVAAPRLECPGYNSSSPGSGSGPCQGHCCCHHWNPRAWCYQKVKLDWQSKCISLGGAIRLPDTPTLAKLLNSLWKNVF